MKVASKGIIIYGVISLHTLQGGVIFSASSGQWADDSMWQGGAKPLITDQAIGGDNHIIELNTTQESGNFLSNATLNVNNGGTLNTSGVNIGQGGAIGGVINLYTGGTINSANRINVNSVVASGDAYLNMYGGTFNVTGDNGFIGTFGNGDGTGTSNFNFDSGIINAAGFLVKPDTSDNLTIVNWNSANSSGAGIDFHLTSSGINANNSEYYTDFGTSTTFNFVGSNFSIGDEITLITSDSETLYTNHENVTINGIDGQLSVSGNDLILTVVPEPTSSALIGIASLSLIIRRKR